MNEHCASDIPDVDAPFTDENRTDLKDDVVNIIKRSIARDVILPVASQTNDERSVAQIIDSAAFKVSWNTHAATRLTKKSLSDAIRNAIASGKTPCQVGLAISIGHVCFKQRNPTCLDWSVFTTNETDVEEESEQSEAELFAEAMKDVLNTARASQPSAADVATAVATAIANAGGNINRNQGQVQGGAASNTAIHTFNHAALPADVRERCIRRRDKKVVLHRHVTNPHRSGNLCCLDGTDCLILPDGTLFIIPTTPDEKALLRDPITCKDDTHQGIRTWHETFARHAGDRGFCVHPLHCFRKDHGGEWGFAVGPNATDDLPQRMRIMVDQMTQPLFRLLQKENMFPRDSKAPQIVSQCCGDGCKAIKQILFQSHPAFQDQPAALITSYPRQRGDSMLKHFSLFQDCLQLRACVSDVDSSLDLSHEVDIFIKNAKCSDFLNRCTRDERKQASFAHKCTSSQLVETLETFLREPDSPLLQEASLLRTVNPARPPMRPSPVRPPLNRAAGARSPSSNRSSPVHSSNRSSPVPRPTPVRQLTAELSDVTSDQSDDIPELSTTDSADSPPELQTELCEMEIPDDQEACRIHALHTASICKLAAEGMNNPKPCIVCNGNHRFDQCEVLNNTNFLRSHCIRFCQQLRREAASRASAFEGDAGSMPTAAPVNFMECNLQSRSEDTEDDQDQDFQSGRR